MVKKQKAAKPKPRKRSSKPSAPSILSDEKEWKAQDDLRTLKRADEIRRDSKRLAEVERQLKKEQEAINSLKKNTKTEKK